MKTHWGSWYLDETSPPSIGTKLIPDYIYNIVLDKCRTVRQQEIWIKHMATKQSISNKDLKDLADAFRGLVPFG